MRFGGWRYALRGRRHALWRWRYAVRGWRHALWRCTSRRHALWPRPLRGPTLRRHGGHAVFSALWPDTLPRHALWPHARAWPHRFHADRPGEPPLRPGAAGGMGEDGAFAAARRRRQQVRRHDSARGRDSRLAAGRPLHGQAAVAGGRPLMPLTDMAWRLRIMPASGTTPLPARSPVTTGVQAPRLLRLVWQSFLAVCGGRCVTAVFWPWPWYEPFWGYGGDYALSNVFWAGPGSLPAYYSNTTSTTFTAAAPADMPAALAGPARAGQWPTPKLNRHPRRRPSCAGLCRPGARRGDLPINDIEHTVVPPATRSQP